MPNTDKTLIYCRTATVKQSQRNKPLAKQIQTCLKKAASLDCEVVATITESGISGVADRIEKIKNLADICRKLEVNTLVTPNLSRLSRNHNDYKRIKALLRKRQIKLIFVETREEELIFIFNKAYETSLSENIKQGTAYARAMSKTNDYEKQKTIKTN